MTFQVSSILDHQAFPPVVKILQKATDTLPCCNKVVKRNNLEMAEVTPSM